MPMTYAQKAKRREYNRQWAAANRERKAAHAKKYREANKEKEAAYHKQYLASHPPRNRPRYIRNAEQAEKKRAQDRDYWRLMSPEDRKVYLARRLARYHAKLMKERAVSNPTLLYETANKAVPRTLPRWVRDDIISELVLAVLSSELAFDKIASQAGKYVTKYWRDFGYAKDISLDAVGFDGKTTLLDRLANEIHDDDFQDQP